MTQTTFTPLYYTEDLSRLLNLWSCGSLDGIHSKHAVVVGVSGFDRPAKGLRPETLLERFSSCDISQVFRAMALDSEPSPTYGAIAYAKLVRGVPLEDIARALGLVDCSLAQNILILAEDDFMRRLLSLQNQS